jgi:hypothetical protein
MAFGFRRLTVTLILVMACLGLPCRASAQQVPAFAPATPLAPAPEVEIPDAPSPQIELASADPQSSQSQSGQQPATGPGAPAISAGQSQNVQQPVSGSDPPSAAGSNPPDTALKNGVTQSSSSTQNSAQPPNASESQREKAAEQIKEQEHQRIAGILPSFNVTYRSDAASMTAGQKMSLAFRSSVDPYTFGIAFIVSGFSEAQDEGTGFGWGPEGYFKRAGAAYLDEFDGTIIGNGILPALLHQDPRYFRLGHGTFRHRFFYAIATSYICKHDNTGKWEPNYSNVGGNIIAGAISNLYYPSQTAGLGQTIDNGLIVTSEGTFGGVLQEFWPDISRKLFHKDPTHGLDAEARAADAAKKLDKQKKQEKQN